MRHRLESAATVAMLKTVKPDLSCSSRKPLSCGVGRERTKVYLIEPEGAALEHFMVNQGLEFWEPWYIKHCLMHCNLMQLTASFPHRPCT